MTEWRKSSLSGPQGGNCVQWAIVPTGVKVRDSKMGDESPVLDFTFSEWVVFLRAVKAGEADLVPSFDATSEEKWVSPAKG